MYYEETIINGVLHWRTSPVGSWIAKTPEQLTAMILELRKLPPYQTYPQPMWTYPGFR